MNEATEASGHLPRPESSHAALLCIRAGHGSHVAVRHTVLLLHRHRQ
ncbi:MAG TPA: hypothetical protein PLS67_12355 [Accumulibacter sp.]|nr:hypothetical protein [Accumulibacter sp.]HQC81286.1 hypothetical protein [Accumulibacter sp.]